MILVPNLRLRLNGSSPLRILPLILLVLSLSACELFKPISQGDGDRTDRDPDRTENTDELDPIQSRRVYDPETGTWVYLENAPTSTMDTVRWTILSEELNPPIVEDGSGTYVPPPGSNTGEISDGSGAPIEQTGMGDFGSRLLSGYKIDFLLPFLANRYNAIDEEIDENSLWALHFYSGAQIALDQLRAEGHNLNVSAQDSEANENKVRNQLRNPAFRESQMVIGPYTRQNVTLAAEGARNREQVVVSPFSASANLSPGNANYIQVNPTLETHCREIMSHAFNTQGADQIFLVSGPDAAQQARFEIFQDAYVSLTNNPEIDPLPTISVAATETLEMEQYLQSRKVVFIMPVYENESLVSNFLRQVYASTRDGFTQVVVYGLPQWQNFSRIDLDYYEGCDVHISASTFINRLNPETRTFQRNFFERFATIPRDEAYLGYDLTLYFARMLRQYGTRFQYALEREPEQMLHTEFRFEPVYQVVEVPEGGISTENPVIDHWENRFVNILRFRNYQFKRIN
ncbi:MAG: ABC transporter substrate-binding protein [Bacteroidota bacterium]